MSRKLLINSRGNYTKFEVPGTDRFIMPVCPTQEQYVSMKLEYGVVIRNIRRYIFLIFQYCTNIFSE